MNDKRLGFDIVMTIERENPAVVLGRLGGKSRSKRKQEAARRNGRLGVGDQDASDGGPARRALLLAGVAMGCPANFAWRGHRRTLPEYRPDDETARLLRERGMRWARDFDAAASEVHALFRFREWGNDTD